MKKQLDPQERDQAAYRAALRLSAISKSEKERELFEAAADELADIIGLSEAMPILEEELDFLRVERRELQTEVEAYEKKQQDRARTAKALSKLNDVWEKLDLDAPDYLSVCTVSCGINHRKEDGSDLTAKDVIEEMTHAVHELFNHFGDQAHEYLELADTERLG
jgi:hypothetical protein